MNMIDKFSGGQYAFLSNFWHSPFTSTDEGEYREWPTVEHYYQAMKVQPDFRDMVHACKTPGQAKRMGNKHPMVEGWDDKKLLVMATGVGTKFATHDDLAKKLIATGDARLVEGNYWHDNYWGNCSCQKCLGVQGENHLGRILMNLRKHFQ